MPNRQHQREPAFSAIRSMQWFGSSSSFVFHKCFKPMDIGDSIGISTFRRLAVQMEGNDFVLWHPSSAFMKRRKIVLAGSISLIGGHSVPLCSFSEILRNALSVFIHECKVMLRACMILLGCDLPPVCRLDMILINAVSVERHLTETAYRLWVLKEIQVLAETVKFGAHLLDFRVCLLVGWQKMLTLWRYVFVSFRQYQHHYDRCWYGNDFPVVDSTQNER